MSGCRLLIFTGRGTRELATPARFLGSVFLVLGTVASVMRVGTPPILLAQDTVTLGSHFLRNTVRVGTRTLALSLFLVASVRLPSTSSTRCGWLHGYVGTQFALLNVLKNSEKFELIRTVKSFLKSSSTVSCMRSY